MKTLFGGYLEAISNEKIREYIDAMNNDMALNMLEAALQYGVRSGLYTLEEAYCVFESLNKMKICADSHGTGFKGPSRLPDVELDEKS